MTKNRNGSCILIMIIISSIIMLYYINLWHSTSLMVEAAFKKHLFEKNFRLTEALYNYGLHICVNNFDFIYAKKKQNISNLVLYDGHWLPNEQKFKGKIIAKLFDDQLIRIETKLTDEEGKNSTINSILIKESLPINHKKKHDNNDKKFRFKVINWQFNET